MSLLGTIKDISRRDRFRNTEIRRNLVKERVRQRIEKYSIRWFGHVQRMVAGMIPTRIGESRVVGRRPKKQMA